MQQPLLKAINLKEILHETNNPSADIANVVNNTTGSFFV